jgi:hypothetical protein
MTISEICSRIYFGNTALVQPTYDTGRSHVCAGCAASCTAINPVLLVTEQPFVCDCQSCLYVSRHGEGASDSMKQQAEQELRTEVNRIVERETDIMGQRVRKVFSIDTIRSISTTSSHLGFTAKRELELEDCVLDVAHHINTTIQLSRYATAVVSPPHRVFYSGSPKECCAVFMALLQSVGIETRMVFSVHGVNAEQVCWPECRITSRGGGPWRYVSLGFDSPIHISDTPPATKGQVLVAIEPSGYATDVTPANACAPYRPRILASHLLEHNVQIIESNPLLGERMAPEITAAAASMAEALMEDLTAKLGDVQQVCQDFMAANMRLVETTVDNDSPVPLRVVLGEVDPVSSLHYAAFCSSVDDIRQQMRGVSLLRRAVEHWPRDLQHLPVRLLSYVLSTFAKGDCAAALQIVSGQDGLLVLFQRLLATGQHPSLLLLVAIVGLITNVIIKAADQVALLPTLPAMLAVLGLVARRALDTPALLLGLFQAVEAVMETFMVVQSADGVADIEMEAVVKHMCVLLSDLINVSKARCALHPAIGCAVASVANGQFERWKPLVRELLGPAVRAVRRIPVPEIRETADSDIFQ